MSEHQSAQSAQTTSTDEATATAIATTATAAMTSSATTATAAMTSSAATTATTATARRISLSGWSLRLFAAAALLASQMGHGDGCCAEEDELFGPPTASTCPQGSTLTYQSFGKPFVEKYCLGCHHSDLMGEARHGAPTFHDFDTHSGIKSVSEHIDQTTAAGPAAVNTGMPNTDPRPTMAERLQLGEWIACGLP